MNTLPATDVMYGALLRRDASFEGVFWACVRTTGIFCRPTCSARKPRPENVDFVGSIQQAMRKGYRPCRICRPLELAGSPPAWETQLISELERHPGRRIRDVDLRERGVDPARARRHFVRRYGVTFHAFQRAHRLGHALVLLQSPTRNVEPGQHGYASASGFREAFARMFGEPPGRADRVNALTAAQLPTPLGPMLAVAGDRGLVLLEFIDRRMLETQIQRIRRLLDAVIVPGDHEHLGTIARELGAYFNGEITRFAVPLDVPGSDFQKEVWAALREIPYGETVSYSDIASAVGRPDAQRAVGRTNGDNRLAIVIPCHRVVRADGSLCGYGGGLWRKKWLLEHERAQA